ncbi:MAG TPA: hypothetical protein VGG19_00985 [Tepidisphaeraceae bacterium]|jgi:hypothetical protein
MDKTKAAALYQKALKHFSAGQISQGRQASQEALKLDKYQPFAPYLLAMMAFQERDFSHRFVSASYPDLQLGFVFSYFGGISASQWPSE